MKATHLPKIDWLSLSPRVMARVMELSEQLNITPKKAFELMVAKAAGEGADLTVSTNRRAEKRVAGHYDGEDVLNGRVDG